MGVGALSPHPVISNPLHFFALCLLGKTPAGGRGWGRKLGACFETAATFGDSRHDMMLGLRSPAG
jgi:hypothetical protein